MRDFFAGMSEKPFRAAQVMKWVYHQGITDFGAMTDLSRRLRDYLTNNTRPAVPHIVSEKTSMDGTRKWLMQVDEREIIETVFIPEATRGTLCVSSQAGCALNCAFCATGKQDYKRNLSVADIIGQLWQANKALGYFQTRSRRISNVVFMGMGEPLLNFDNVVKAIELMTDDLGFGLSNKRITLSTAGIVPGIIKLAKCSKVSLAVSLHAPNDTLREKLVPINRTYPIARLLDACRQYSEASSGAPVTFEYVMLKGVNDSGKEARELADLLRGFPAKVNLIPFNPFPDPVFDDPAFECSPMQTIDDFRDRLMQSGIITITRKTRGDDINAACGQLTGEVIPPAKHSREQQR